MLSEMSITEFREWVAFAELEPFEETRADQRAGSIVAAILNSNRTRRGKIFKLSDTTLHFGDSKPVKRRQSWQEMLFIAKMYAVSANSAKQHS